MRFIQEKTKNLNEVVNMPGSTLDEPFTSRIFKAIWELKKKGGAEATLRGVSKKLKQLSRETNLDYPKAVKEYIANKKSFLNF